MNIKTRVTSQAAALALAAVLLGAAPAQAQDQKVGLYAGYAFLKSDDGNLHGLRLSPEFRLNGFASLVGDVSLEKGTVAKTGTTVITYLGGLRLNRGIGSVRLFAHALVGRVRTSGTVKPFGGVSISVTESALGLDGGGGFEFKVGGSLKMRIGADYLRQRIDTPEGVTANQNDIRATAGFVFP